MSRVLKNGEILITQGFSNSHRAVDLVKYPRNIEAVTAHSDGTVVFCQTGRKNAKGSKGNESYGNFIKIDHGSGYITLYAHLSRVYVHIGDKVKAGQEIGYMGNTGNSYGAHLHFEVRKNNVCINPIPYLKNNLPVEKSTVEEIANEVIAGKWGNGTDRKNKLTVAGYNYSEIQDTVNKKLSGKNTVRKSNTEIAKEIIRGKWGNGSERKERLKAAGYDYATVQSIVNSLLR